MKLKMSSSVCCSYWRRLVLMCFLVAIPSAVTSLDISKVLSQYPAYSTFSKYLKQTQLASKINARQSVTLLVVHNRGMGPLSGKSMDQIKKMLSVHVALHYLDLQEQENQSITLSTLWEAHDLTINNGAVTFVSAAYPNGVVCAKLMKPIIFVSEPHTNISLVQVNSLIMATNPDALAESPVPVISPAPIVNPIPVNSPSPVPVPVIAISPMPVPATPPAAVASPVPVISPLPMPVPVTPPAAVVSPVPVISPLPMPVPVTPPAAVVSPVPVISPLPMPVPVISPMPVPVTPPAAVVSPVAVPGSGGASESPAGSGSSPADYPKSGVLQFGVNWSLAILLTFSSIYMNPMLYHYH